MNKQLNTALRLSALSLALLAAGCGGGSSSTNSGAELRSISSTAAKGIVKGGLVQLYTLNALGQKSATPAATSTTASNGSFTVSLPKNLLLFIIEVGAAPGAVIADEATGRDIPMPTDLVLRNVVTLAEGAESYSGSVTPLTELAVRTAEKASGGLNASNIALAKEGVRKLFGFDPETITPVNANSPDAANASDMQKIQALILAAISQMSRDGVLGCVAADIKCVVDKVANAGSLSGNGIVLGTDLIAVLRTAIQQVVADPAINRTGRTNVDLPLTSSQTPSAAESGAASAKKLFASLRNSFNVVSGGSTALEGRTALVITDFKNMTSPLDKDLKNWITVPSFAIDYLARYKAGQSIPATVQLDGDGQCLVVSDDGFENAATNASNAKNIFCSVNKTVSITSTQAGTTRKVVSQVMGISPGSTGDAYTYTSHTRLDTFVNNSRTSREVIGNYGNTANRATGTITYTVGSSRANFAIKGDLPARTDSNGVKLSDFEVWDLKATVVEANAVSTYDLAATMTSILNGAEAGTIIVNPGSRLIVKAVPGVFKPSLVQSLNLFITGKSGGSAITGALGLTNWKGDKTSVQHAPAIISFSGSLTEGGLPLFSGELTYANAGFEQFDSVLPLSDTNFLTQTVRLSGELAVPQRPALAVFLSATTGKADGGDLVAQYGDGISVINFVGKRASGVLDAAAVSSSSGVTLSFTATDVAAKRTVDVRKDSAVVATLNLGTSVINYADGSFESLR